MKGTTSQFIKCLYSIVNNPTLETIVCWANEGNAFIIKDLIEFEQRILSNYFPDIKIKEFRKKLKELSFTKCVNNETITYTHPQFQQKKPNLLRKIHCFSEIVSRKKNKINSAMTTKVRILESAQVRMEEKAANLEKKFQKIIDFNKCIINQLNQHFAMSEYYTEYIKKLMSKQNTE
ncbi:hypothetical protein SteCoe_9286 [Stentor coeruleus]|uniref:HSF-type DNA-binding domain-containing protein n=1 Tax=Stentor coeruleus TaxID=5963 RepID=A0A1R2CIC0_9CILI|nr:hypothetical protein SteCoe_9286 [Stentor coeruleus]